DKGLVPISLELREHGESPRALLDRRDPTEIAADDDTKNNEITKNENQVAVTFSHRKGKSSISAHNMEVGCPKTKNKSKVKSAKEKKVVKLYPKKDKGKTPA
ncbi:hypothetical protein U1Q18_037631, partial [Sarracenia purpurea var. burkii]